MYKSGLLVLSSLVGPCTLRHLLLKVHKFVDEKVYLLIANAPNSLRFWRSAMNVCYNTANSVHHSLDLCLLLPESHKRVSAGVALNFDVCITNSDSRETNLRYAHQLNPVFGGQTMCIETEEYDKSEIAAAASMPVVYESFTNVCVGGTFDCLHNGHKILLSTAALLTSNRLLVGVTSDAMLGNKPLAPLVHSYDSRCGQVCDFFSSIGYSPHSVEFAKLDDDYGPPLDDPKFQCVVASKESVARCKKLNDLRVEKAFPILDVDVIDFVEDPCVSIRDLDTTNLDTSKLSSSILRFNKLGILLRPVIAPIHSKRKPGFPYVIGLTGPSGAGKTSLAGRLKNLSSSIHVIDCDKLGHEAYTPGSACYKAVVEHFGFDAIASPEPPHPIDRSRLGRIVFSDQDRMRELNALVWPAIRSQVEELLTQMSTDSSTTRSVAVLDAAVLQTAGWDDICDEVWVATISRKEAQRRICERSNVPPNVASDRLDRQATSIAEACDGLTWWDVGQLDTGRGPVGRAHVVLSTEWASECTQRQVEKAFSTLQSRIHSTL